PATPCAVSFHHLQSQSEAWHSLPFDVPYCITFPSPKKAHGSVSSKNDGIHVSFDTFPHF
ncbi:hypothetical protein, partial [Eisenbergiella porci]|uniref:hypothetical protein n=1 Tax=Eisenbergiella porci TaxID=2652274 RepID=UPI002A80DA60